MIYIPNSGEVTALKAILGSLALRVGLFKNALTPDGNTVFGTLQELSQGGGRSYVTKDLPPVVVEDTLTEGKWYLATDVLGKGAAQYCDGAPPATYLEWTFAAADVADAPTVYGAFGWTLIIPFANGSAQINPGDIIAGATSGAKGTVTAVWVASGSWTAGTAAGWLAIKTQTGTFQTGENLKISGQVSTITINDGGAGYAQGDIVSITQTGGSGTKVCITEVAAGVVTAVALVDGGQGHSLATALTTANIVGSGSGLKLNITGLSTAAAAVTNTGTLFGGDSLKTLIFVESFASSIPITLSGQKIQYTLTLTMSTG